MSLTYEYVYTVSSYIDWNKAALAEDITDSAAQSYENTELWPNLVGDYLENNGVYRTGNTLNLTQHTTTIEPDFSVVYNVRFYMVVKDTSAAPYGAGTFTPTSGVPQNPTVYWLGSKDHGQTNITDIMINSGTTGTVLGNLNIVDNFTITCAVSGELWPNGSYGDTGVGKPAYNYIGKINPGNPAVKTYVDPLVAKYTYMCPINNNGDTFKLSVSPKAAGFTMNPGVTFSGKIINNYNASNNTGWLDTNSATQIPSAADTTVPYFNVSDRRITPAEPDALRLKLTGTFTIGGWPLIGSAIYDFCGLATGLNAPSWLGFYIQGIPASSTAATAYSGKYKVIVYASNLNGTSIKQLDTFTEARVESTKGGSTNYGPKLTAWYSKARLAVLANCGAGTTSTNAGGDYTPTVAPTDEERYNPPPHIDARDISFGQRMITYADQSAAAGAPIISDPAAFYSPNYTSPIGNMLIGYTGESPRTQGLGRLIQDVNTAASLNTNPDNLALGTAGNTGSKLWGFRFMYNPTAIQYSTSSNNQIDFTLGSKDPANLLAGNQQVNIELYFNRIPDMQYLRDYSTPKGPANLPSLTKQYGYEISNNAIQGILKRGTEYDIEYLYRVINGDPIENSLLFGNSYKGPTSDFGYTTATPCWLYLNDNLRYFGSVASITVYHRVFTLDMIPMFSVVDISFNRYPAVWTDKAAGTSFNDLYSAKGGLASSLTSTTTSNTTGTGKPTGGTL